MQSILKPIMLRRTKNSTDKEGRYIQLWLWCILSFYPPLWGRGPLLNYSEEEIQAGCVHLKSLHSIKPLSPLHMNFGALSPLHMNNLFGTWLVCMLLCRPILNLPPANIEVKYCDLSEAEKDFYEALFRRSKVMHFNWLACSFRDKLIALCCL